MKVTVWVDVPEGARGEIDRRSLRELADLLSGLRLGDNHLSRVATSDRVRVGPKESFRDRDSLRPEDLLEELDLVADALRVPDLRESTMERILARDPLHDHDDEHLIAVLRPDWVVLRDAVLFARQTGHSAWIEGPLVEGEDVAGDWGPPRHPWVPDDLSGLRLPWDGLVAAVRGLDLQGAASSIDEAVLWGRWCQRRFAQWRRESSSTDLDSLRADPDLRVVQLGTWHGYASAFTWGVRPGGAHWAATLSNGRLERAELDALLHAILATVDGGFGLVEEGGVVWLVLSGQYRHPPPDREEMRAVLVAAKADGARVDPTTLKAFVEQAGGRLDPAPSLGHGAPRPATTLEFAVSHRSGNVDVALNEGRIATIVVR